MQAEKMEQNETSLKQEITIDSNWIMTIGMALLLVFCTWQLIRDARYLALGNLSEQVLFTHVIDKIGIVILAVYCFLFAFSFHALHVRLALILLGTEAVVRLSLSYLHVSPATLHVANIGESIADQVALAIIAFAIVQWFRSVIHWISPSKTGEAKS
jgi:hypothetical protein